MTTRFFPVTFPKTGDDRPFFGDDRPFFGDDRPFFGDDQPFFCDEKRAIGRFLLQKTTS